jgi:hypothetical protein
MIGLTLSAFLVYDFSEHFIWDSKSRGENDCYIIYARGNVMKGVYTNTNFWHPSYVLDILGFRYEGYSEINVRCAVTNKKKVKYFMKYKI